MTERASTPYRGTDLDDDAWRADGMCREVDPDLWYPENGENAAWAKRICAGCPVIGQCLEAALDGDERFGVWGGLTAHERSELHTRRRSA